MIYKPCISGTFYLTFKLSWLLNISELDHVIRSFLTQNHLINVATVWQTSWIILHDNDYICSSKFISFLHMWSKIHNPIVGQDICKWNQWLWSVPNGAKSQWAQCAQRVCPMRCRVVIHFLLYKAFHCLKLFRRVKVCCVSVAHSLHVSSKWH